MKIDKFTFDLLSKAPIADYMGVVGVYILWDSQAKKKPSYIGEGGILKRFSDHETNFSHPINGYVTEGGHISCRSQLIKKDSELLEAVLLHIAARIDKDPIHNQQTNYKSPIAKYFKNNRVLRFELEGYDPFLNPSKSEKLRGKEIYLEKVQNKIHLKSHPWKKHVDSGYGSILFQLEE
jgi:hypothetical protein